jgi:hypothetical protein
VWTTATLGSCTSTEFSVPRIMDIKLKEEDGGFGSSFFPFNNVYMDPNSSTLAELGGLLSLENEDSTGFNYYEEPPPATYMPIETAPIVMPSTLSDTVRYASRNKQHHHNAIAI